MLRNFTVARFSRLLLSLFVLTGLGFTVASAQPVATLVKPSPGASTGLIITFDRQLEAATTSITTANALISTATNDFGGANTPIVMSGSAGSVIWNLAVTSRPIAHVSIPSTTFVSGQTVRINFVLNAVQDQATSTPIPVATNVLGVVSPYTTLHTTDFETTSTYTPTNQVTDNTNQYWNRFNRLNEEALAGSDDHDLENPIVGTQGDFYYAGENITNAAGEGAITTNAFNVVGYNHLQLKVLQAATGSGYDAAQDYIKIEYSYDGGAYTVVGAWGGNQFDADNNNTGEGFSLTATFLDATYIIPTGGTDLTVRIRAFNTGGDEEFVFDNIRLVGVDNVSPTAAITYDDTDGIVKATQVVRITATFNEAIKDAPPAMQVSLSGANTLALTDMVKSSSTVYYYDHTVGAGDGTVTVALGTGTDLAHNVITSAPTSGATFTVDNTLPAAFTTGAVASTGGTVVAGYWNSTNTNLTVVVPLDNADASLDNGTVQIELANGTNNTFYPIGSSGLSTITNGERVAGTKTVTIAAADLEATTDFTQGETITIRAITTDVAVNSTTGANSATTFVHDQVGPLVALPDLAAGFDTGFSNTDDYTNLTTVDFSGTAETGASVELFDGVTSKGTTPATGGNWSFTGITIGTGARSITAVATDAAGNATTSAILTVTVDQTDPSAFTTGTATVTGGTVVSGYWNISNTGIDIVVPLNNADASLDDGTVQVELANTTNNIFYPIAASGLSTITNGERVAGTKTISILAADIEGTTDFADGETINFRAIITDKAANPTTGANSATSIIVDETPVGAFTTGAVASTGGTVVAGYWNSTNTNLTVVVPLSNVDASLDNGTVQVQLANGTNNTFFSIASSGLSTITNGERIAGTKMVTITAAHLEATTDFTQGETITIRAIITDAAGNGTTGANSATTFVNDQVGPAVSLPDLAAGFDTGPLNNDDYTNLTTVDFSGTAETNTQVELFDGITSKGTTTATGGNWSFTGVSIGTGARSITAVSTDVAGNTTTSAILTVTVDQTVPTNQTPTTLVTAGGRVVANYWNSTNTSLGVTAPLANGDASLDGGTMQVRIMMTGGSLANVATSGLSTITNGQRTAGTKTVSVAEADLEGTAGFTDGNTNGPSGGSVIPLIAAENKFLIVAVRVTDLAGNFTDFTQSVTEHDVDRVAPSITGGVTLYSDVGAAIAGSGDGSHEVLQFVFDENITLADGNTPLSTNTAPTGAAGFYAGGTIETSDSRYKHDGLPNALGGTNTRLIYLESSGNTNWTGATTLAYTQSGIPGSGNFIRDAAGNEMTSFTGMAVSAGTTTTIAAAASGVAASPINNSSINQVVFAFSLTTSGPALNMTALSLAASSDPTGKLENFRLFSNTTADNFGAAINLGLTASTTPTSVDFNAISVPLTSTPRYFYLVADVEDYFFSASPQIQFSLTSGGLTLSAGGKAGSHTGTNYTLSDITAPVASVTNTVNPIYLGALTQTVRVQFNEPMNNATAPAAGMITISGGNWAAFAGGAWSTTSLTNDTYTVTLTHNGTAQTSLESSTITTISGITDWGGNTHATAGSALFLVDTQRPTVSSMSTNLSAVTLTSSTIRVTVQYNESMSTASAPSISFTNGTFGAGVPVSGAGYTNGWRTVVFTNDTYEADFTNSTTNEEFLAVTADANGAIDANGNTQNVAATSNIFDIDTQRPTVVSITRLGGTPTNASVLSYQVVFSEQVTSISVGDFAPVLVSTVSGTPFPGNVIGFSSVDNITWTVNVGGVVGDGDVRLDVLRPPAVIRDLYNNLLLASKTGDEVYTIDQTAPLATAIDISTATEPWSTANGTSATTLTWLVTFNDDVNNVDAADFTLDNPAGAAVAMSLPLVVTGSGNTRTVTLNNVKLLTLTGNSQLKINLVDNNTITDNAGNFLGGPALGDGTLNSVIAFPGNDFYTILFPQPSDPAINYLVNFQNTTNIGVQWTNPVAPVTPSNYYFVQIKRNSVPLFPVLNDGTYPQDFDFSDGTLQEIFFASSSNSIDFVSYFGIGELTSGFGYDIKITSVNYSGFYNGQYHLDYLTSSTLTGTANTTVASNGTLTFNSSSSTISSISTASPGTSVFTFTIDDDGASDGADNAPFKFNNLVIIPGPSNTVANWTTAINGARLINTLTGKFVDGTVNAGDITFSSIPSNDSDNPDLSSTPDLGYIFDNATKQYTLRIWLDNPLGVNDNSILDFRVNNASFSYDNTNDVALASQSSSQLAPAQIIQSGAVSIDVRASKLVFNVQPQPQIGVATAFSLSSQAEPQIRALDANNNLDLNYNAAFTAVTSIGFTPVHTNFSAGVLTLASSFFTAAGSSTITIRGNATGIPFFYPALTGPGVEAVSNSVDAVISNTTTISEATAPASELASFPSITNALPIAHNFDFAITDDVGVDATDFVDNDGLPTVVQTVTITQGSANGDNGGGSDLLTFDNWTNSILGAQLTAIGNAQTVNGTINSGSLVFNVPVGSFMETVPNDGSKTYQLRIWLRNPVDASLRDILDNKDFAFAVNQGNIGIGAVNTTSTLAASSASTADGRNVVTATATQLDFVTQPPPSQNYDADLTVTPVVKARDANQNLDLDYTSNATLVPVFIPTGPDNLVPHAYPLSNTAFTFVGGIVNLSSVAVNSSGNGIHNDVIQLRLDDTPDVGSVASGQSSNIILTYSGASDIVRDGSFTHPTNIVSINNREAANLTAGNSIALDRFQLRDGGASNDSDGSKTKLQSITFNVTNFLNIRRIGIYDEGGTEIQELDSTAFTPGGDITFSSFANAFDADDDDQTTKLLTVRASFRAFVSDNQQINVSVTAATASGVSSQLIPISIPGDNLGTDKNKIEVVATRIDFTTVPTSASINVSFTVVAQARDVYANLDLDYNGAVSFTGNGNTSAYTVVNLPTGNFTAGVLNYPIDNIGTPGVDEGFYFTSGTTFTQLTINGGAANTTGESVDASAITGISPAPGIDVQTSYDSWLYFDPSFPYTNRIPFVDMQETTLTNTTNSINLARLVLSDGGAPGTTASPSNPSPGVKNMPLGFHNDIDGASTKIDALTISLTNFADIRKIALFDNLGNKIGSDQNPAATVTFSALSGVAALTAADNDVARFYIRASFNDVVGADLDQINIQIVDVVWSSGSQFPLTDGTTTEGGIDGAGSGGDSSDPAFNYIDVVATSLDFVTPASLFAGKNEPIGPSYTASTPLPGTSAAIVHARDKFMNRDLEFDLPPASISITGTDAGVISSDSFVDGILDLDGMQYTTLGVTPENGTLRVQANGLDSSNPGPSNIGNSQPGQPVNVVHVSAIKVKNGVIGTPNIKGGTPNTVIFALGFLPDFNTNAEPSLKGFTFSFDFPYQTAAETIFKNFKVFQKSDSIFVGSIQVDPAKVATGSSTASANLDLVIVDFSASPVQLYNPATGQAAPKYYFLMADVEVTANIATQNLTPQLIDAGYGTSTDANIILTKGTATASVIGQKYQFASTRPPLLIPSECVPFNGQLNVSALTTQIQLKFDIQVWSLDGVAELINRSTNEKVADLDAIDGVYDPLLGTLSPTANPITFNVNFLAGESFQSDEVYYVTVKKGTLDNINNIKTGISDNGFNFYGGISSNATLYFKISSEDPPALIQAKSYYSNLTSGSFSTKFDQRGTAYYLVLDHTAFVSTGSDIPTNSDIQTPLAYAISNPGSVVASGNYSINQVNEFQTVSFGASLAAGSTYDVWIFAKNDANPVNISTTAPYGGSAAGFAAGATGPTIEIDVPTLSNIQYSHQPSYLLCPDSYFTVTDPIVIGETAAAGFQFGSTQDFNILLPTGFQFDGVNLPTVTLIGSDFTQPSLVVKFINTTIVNVEYFNNGSASIDNIIITNLRLIGAAGSVPGNIIRFAGDAVLPGTSTLATISIVPPTDQKFTNSYTVDNDFSPYGFDSDDIITAIPDNYIDEDVNIEGGIRLIPKITPANDYGASLFVGNGITNDVLSLSAVALNSAFDITMTHADVNGCVSETSVQYVVYDHRSPVSPKLGSAQGGTQQAVVNTLFPAPAPTVSFPNTTLPRINYTDLAGYNLINLYCNIPENAGAQIISGPDWQNQVAKIPVMVQQYPTNNIPGLPAGTGFYRDFQWDYTHILNAVPESFTDNPGTTITVDPYDNFDLSTPSGNTYWTGGSLGKVEFTGTFQSTADLTVLVPFRQEVELFVPPIPVIELGESNQPVAGTPIYCEAGGGIILGGFPAASAGSSTGFFEIFDATSGTPLQASAPNSAFVDNGNGTATIFPVLINGGGMDVGIKNGYQNIKVRYTYKENTSPIAGKDSVIIRVTPNPVANFNYSAYTCIDTLISFNHASTIAQPANFSITKWDWNFDDDLSGQKADNSAAEDTVHVFNKPGNYNVTYTVFSQFGCASNVEAKLIPVGAIPDVQFSFLGVSTGETIQFTSNSTVAPPPNSGGVIASENWSFGDGGTGTGNTASHQYNLPNIYPVQLVVTSTIGCINNLTRDVVIVPNFTPTDAAPFEEQFTTNNGGGWQVLADSAWRAQNPTLTASWKWGNPTGNVITGGNAAWTTSSVNNTAPVAYNGRERSALYSPVFDITQLARPMISFNSFVQLHQADGVVLQYSTDNFNIADSRKVWTTLGAINQGISSGVAWYNGENLASQPGDQTVNIYGWTLTPNGDSDPEFEWLESKHSLGDILGSQTKVVFRFALASANQAPTLDGFALDNVRIGNRTRIVLLENFRNLGSGVEEVRQGQSFPIEKFESDSLKAFNPSGTATSIVKINYHVAFPNMDPLNLDNKQDPGARALYYNISKTPRVMMDGSIPADALFSTWGENEYNIRSLKLADAELTPVITNNPDGTISISVTVRALKDLGPKTILNIAMVEKLIDFSNLSTAMQALVKTKENNFEFVLKKMLPSAAGTHFNQALLNTQTRTFGPFDWSESVPLYTPNDDLAIVIFLQDEDSKEVYQTDIIDLGIDPDITTGIEDRNTSFNVYPIPADNEMVIELPEPASRPTALQMFDQLGRTVEQSHFEKGDSRKAVNTTSFAAGVYLIQIDSPKGILRRKVMVTHKN